MRARLSQGRLEQQTISWPRQNPGRSALRPAVLGPVLERSARLSKAAQKYYIVWKGRRTGLFTRWDDCAASVQGFPGAQYLSFDNLEAAQKALAGRYEDHLKDPALRSGNAASMRRAGASERPRAGFVVDAACSGNPGKMEYRCVHLEDGHEVFHTGPYAYGTNNIGEFLAIVHTLSYLKAHRSTAPVYSDSTVAIGWVKAGKCKTRLERRKDNDALFEQVTSAEHWLAENDWENPLRKWDTAAWGESPADFGRK